MGTTPNLALPYPELTDAPNGPVQIAALAAALDALFPLGAGAWAAWVPTVIQGATANIAKTTTVGRYQRVGRIVHARCSLTMTGAGTAAAPLYLTAPVVGAFTVGVNAPIGYGTFFNASDAAQLHKVIVVLDSAGQLAFFPASTSGTSFMGQGGSPWTEAIANNDQLSLSVTYDAAA